jgi:hypothetical protein
MMTTPWSSRKGLPRALKRALGGGLAAAVALALAPATAHAQHGHDGPDHPNLHVNPRWSECSLQLDASLTQEAWRQFTGEAGVLTYFRPLVDAAPLGAGRFEVSVLQWKTGIDDHDAAWNDTFVHPNDTHVLFEGSGLKFPGLTVRAGVSDRTDVGAYFTQNRNANYGFYGAQAQHNLWGGGGSKWAASARVSFVSLFGPEDLDLTVYGVDLLASRRIALTRRVSLSPYAVVTASLSRAHEKSAVADLRDESVPGAQATVGVSARLSVARVAVEYAVARVPSFSLKVGVGR